MMTSGRLRPALVAAGAAALLVALVACTAHRWAGASGSAPVTRTTIVGTSTVTSTSHTDVATYTLVSSSSAVPSSAAPGTAPSSTHPSTTAVPAAVIGECPYIAASDVMAINGQHNGPTSIIPVKPYPICVFTRSDGGYLATTRIITASSPAAATAIVDSFAPVDQSFPVNLPAGWSGGAMALPNGSASDPHSRSVYAVSKGPIVIVAESNQEQSIKGRQMVQQIVKNLGW